MAAGFDPKSDAIAMRLRHHWRRDVPALYHGTDALGMILAQNTLRIAPHGDRCVSLTRSPAVAVYFAMLHRDQEPDAGVLILDRRRLNARYALDVRHAFDWDGCGNGPAPHEFDEAEEAVWTDIHGLDRFRQMHQELADLQARREAIEAEIMGVIGGRNEADRQVDRDRHDAGAPEAVEPARGRGAPVGAPADALRGEG